VNPATCAMVPLMSARSLYPPVQNSQRMVVLGVMELEGTFEKADDPPTSYPVRKCTCVPRKSVIKFRRDCTSVS